jgi:basic amino acid/polyamine antiporter, APA family
MHERKLDSPDRMIRVVGFWGLVALCINGVVGSGVYLLPSESYRFLGPFSLWAPLLFAVPVFILVLCFAEAASHFDRPGGAYLYSRTAFGDFIGFETGWMNMLARVTSLASLANGFVLAVARLYPGASEPFQRGLILTLMLVIIGCIHAAGVRYGAGTIYVFTIGKMLPLLAFVVIGLVAFRSNPLPASFTIPGAEAEWSKAAFLLLFAYAGFENMGNSAGEYRNPRKDLPLALLVATLGIAALYSLTQLAAMSALPDLSMSETPIADAAAQIIGPAGALLMTLGATISIFGTNLDTMLQGSRMLYTLTLDHRPYTPLSWLHRTARTPYVAIIFLVLVSVPVAIAGTFVTLALLSAVARLATYLSTCAALPVLRRRSAPGFYSSRTLLVPILGILVSLTLVAVIDRPRLIAAAVALLVGAALWGLSRVFGAPAASATEPPRPL